MVVEQPKQAGGVWSISEVFNARRADTWPT
jgi:hypothetical protein